MPSALAVGWCLGVLSSCTDRTGPTPPPVEHGGYYAAPYGSRDGDGTWQRPWDLVTALAGAGGRIQPGDTIWLRGGRYIGPFTSRLTGTREAPIIVRQVPGERATLANTSLTDVALNVNGQWVWYWGFEVMNSLQDFTAMRPNGVYPHDANNKFINLVIRDNNVGLSFSNESRNSEVYGCIIYNNGYAGIDRTHGHGIYVKNDAGSDKVVRDNIVFNQFRNGIQIYTDSGSGQLRNVVVDGNVWFNNGALTATNSAAVNILVGGWEIADAITLRDNMTFFSPTMDATNVRIGYANSLTNGSVTLEANYLAGGSHVLAFGHWTQATVTANLFIGSGRMLSLADSVLDGYAWSQNTYWRDSLSAAWEYAGMVYTFRAWQQATGLGAADQVTTEEPGGAQVFLRPNAYESGRANIIVYNWGRQATIAVDVSRVLQTGDRFKLHNVQDYYGVPVLQGTYDGAPLTIPMTGVAPPAPVGGALAPAPRTGPLFDVFVLERAVP